MPDIQLRFHHDMLVLSGPLDASLAKQGLENTDELELLLLTESESVKEALRLEQLAGAQCLVCPAPHITEARLARMRLDEHAPEIARQSFEMAHWFTPQHIIVEIASTLLPIDSSMKSSLMANRDQYSAAAKHFAGMPVDAFLLDDLQDADDVRCALMGVRRVSGVPVFASVSVDGEGRVVGCGASVESIVEVMAEYEASVVGVAMDAELDQVEEVVHRLASTCDLPILVQLAVHPETSRLPKHTHESAFWHPDTMLEAASRLRAAGAQFLRAAGQATPTYTGALVAASSQLSTVR